MSESPHDPYNPASVEPGAEQEQGAALSSDEVQVSVDPDEAVALPDLLAALGGVRMVAKETTST